MTDMLAPLSQADLDHTHGVVGQRWMGLKDGHVFLTGGTGFVGKWLLATLLDTNRRLGLGCRVTVLTRNPVHFDAHAPHLARAPGVELLEGDVRQLAPTGKRYTHVIHAATDASYDVAPLEMFDTCVEGTRRVLSIAAESRARSVLLVSSGAVYGQQPAHLMRMREDFAGTPEPLQTMSAYAAGKRAAEWVAHAFAKERGLNLKTARCFAFVGPYLPLDKHYAIGNFLRDAMAHRPIVIQGDGTPMRSYLHAADMAAWLWIILLFGQAQGIYNVGGDEAVSILQLAQKVLAAVGSGSTIEVLKVAPAGAAPNRYLPDTTVIRSELQLERSLPLDESIRRTATWHANQQPFEST